MKGFSNHVDGKKIVVAKKVRLLGNTKFILEVGLEGDTMKLTAHHIASKETIVVAIPGEKSTARD